MISTVSRGKLLPTLTHYHARGVVQVGTVIDTELEQRLVGVFNCQLDQVKTSFSITIPTCHKQLILVIL